MPSENTKVEHSTPLSIDRNHDDEGSDEIVDALQTIVSDVNVFLSTWFQKLDQCVASCSPDMAPDAILEKRLSNFQDEKIAWELKRELEEREIQQKADQLTEAWLRLEQEQRTFLQMKDPPRNAGSDRGLPHAAASRSAHEDSLPVSDRGAFSEPPPAGGAPANRHGDWFPTARARDSAVRQFQQLRREIESSRPNVDRSAGIGEQVRLFFGDRP